MKEWTREEVLNNRNISGNLALYFYTPLCGTCQLASKMLDIVEKIVLDHDFVKSDLNYVPEAAEMYSIESVPCLIIFQQGSLKHKIYAFQSVPYLYDLFKGDLD